MHDLVNIAATATAYQVYSNGQLAVGVPQQGGIPIEGGQNRLARPSNCTQNLERKRRRPPIRRSYCPLKCKAHHTIALLGNPHYIKNIVHLAFTVARPGR